MTRSRQLRRDTTKAEELLWKHLRNRQVADAKFRRQAPLDSFIVDFICEKAKVIAELDGGQHAEHVVYDAERTAALEAYGYIVLRYWNADVLAKVEGVLRDIEDVIKSSGNP